VVGAIGCAPRPSKKISGPRRRVQALSERKPEATGNFVKKFIIPDNAPGPPRGLFSPAPAAAGALPVGLQLIGRRGHDMALLQLAARVESALSGP